MILADVTAFYTEFKTMPLYRGRFAPSPTGPLHFGSLVAAVGSFLRARSQGGEWLVRVEDIDTPRVIPGAAQAQLDTLRQLGLEWDGEILWQSQRTSRYREVLQHLIEQGAVFACHCTRTDLQGRPHRQCVASTAGGLPAYRLRLPDQTLQFTDGIRGPQSQHLAQEVGDVVLWRRDGLVAYQLAVVVDDADQGITEVVRGADLLDSTARQIFLQRTLGLPHPDYAHLPLALAPDGHKLGKSRQSNALDRHNPLASLHAAWQFLGQSPEVVSEATSPSEFLDLAVRFFALDQIPAHDMTCPE